MTTNISGKAVAPYKLLGRSAQQSGFTFQPAEFRMAGFQGGLEYPLHDFAGQPPPAVLRLAFEEQYDAAWVRARLPKAFDYAPDFVEEADSALLDVGFLARPQDSSSGQTVR